MVSRGKRDSDVNALVSIRWPSPTYSSSSRSNNNSSHGNLLQSGCCLISFYAGRTGGQGWTADWVGKYDKLRSECDCCCCGERKRKRRQTVCLMFANCYYASFSPSVERRRCTLERWMQERRNSSSVSPTPAQSDTEGPPHVHVYYKILLLSSTRRSALATQYTNSLLPPLLTSSASSLRGLYLSHLSNKCFN